VTRRRARRRADRAARRAERRVALPRRRRAAIPARAQPADGRGRLRPLRPCTRSAGARRGRPRGSGGPPARLEVRRRVQPADADGRGAGAGCRPRARTPARNERRVRRHGRALGHNEGRPRAAAPSGFGSRSRTRATTTPSSTASDWSARPRASSRRWSGTAAASASISGMAATSRCRLSSDWNQLLPGFFSTTFTGDRAARITRHGGDIQREITFTFTVGTRLTTSYRGRLSEV